MFKKYRNFCGFSFAPGIDSRKYEVQNSSFRRSSSKAHDCIVYLAQTNRLRAFYFWAAFKNYRWHSGPVSPSGQAKTDYDMM